MPQSHAGVRIGGKLVYLILMTGLTRLGAGITRRKVSGGSLGRSGLLVLGARTHWAGLPANRQKHGERHTKEQTSHPLLPDGGLNQQDCLDSSSSLLRVAHYDATAEYNGAFALRCDARHSATKISEKEAGGDSSETFMYRLPLIY